MPSINSFFRIVGVVVIGLKSLKTLCIGSYLTFTAWCLHNIFMAGEPAPPLTKWILATQLSALVSGYLFWHYPKGKTVSVIGSLAYTLNFGNMIILSCKCSVS